MSRIKGRHVAQVVLDFDADEHTAGLKPFDEIQKDFKNLTGDLKELLDDEFGVDDICTVEVMEQYSDIYKVEE